MNASVSESAVLKQFDDWYAHMRAPVMAAIDRSVCGCDYGGTSWTTREEADRIAGALALAPGKRLLEVGAGSGWPGLYFAQRSGCAVVLADLPAEGLKLARERAEKDGLAARCQVMQADGGNLPLHDASADAVSHSDVLCCLLDKAAVLSECRRVVRPHGRMAFAVIFVADGLSPQDRADAVAAGPPFVESDRDYRTLLAQTGWRVVGVADLTAAFCRSMRTLIGAREKHRDQLKELLGPAVYDDMMARSRENLPRIERGLLQRALFTVEPLALAR